MEFSNSLALKLVRRAQEARAGRTAKCHVTLPVHWPGNLFRMALAAFLHEPLLNRYSWSSYAFANVLEWFDPKIAGDARGGAVACPALIGRWANLVG